jgi:uncharacterized protein (DUF983 family)
MTQTTTKTALLRGLKLRCPKCGEGKLLNGYLSQAEKCSSCHEPIGQIRADDGPAWLTILLTGHILAPLILELEARQAMALVPELALIISLAIGLIAILLPRSKGVFIAAIWVSRQTALLKTD